MLKVQIYKGEKGYAPLSKIGGETMAVLKFLYGNNLSSKTPYEAGTIYLDLATNEFWFDAPGESSGHKKIIDSDTLLFSVAGSMSFSPESSAIASAKLGVARLGSMVLGSS